MKDFSTAEKSDFFGDRDLNNPGYSKFELSGEVGVGTQYKNSPLDVFRVEQRLKYLGFSTFGMIETKGVSGVKPAVPKEFVVDGTFGKEEKSALQGFYAATHYLYNRGSGSNGIQTATGEAKVTVAPGESNPKDATDDTNWEWLNAYNAPHWLNIFQFLRLEYKNGTYGNFIVHQDHKEVYGTSWLGDLLKAWDISHGKQGLTTGRIQINGLTDPTLSLPVHAKGAHSVGMGLDLGVGLQYIDARHQIATFDKPAPPSTGPFGWSVDNAIVLADQLVLPNGHIGAVPENNQAGALRNFLSIYAVTRNDGANGTRA